MFKKSPITPKNNVKSQNALALFIAASIIAGISFYMGTRSHDIEAFLSPLTGVKRSTESLDLSDVQSTYQYLSANYDGKLDKRALIEGANKGLVAAAGNQYTVYMNASEAKDFQKELSGDVGAGIGAELGMRGTNVTIVRTLEGNSAQSAGVLAGDIVVSVNGESAAGWQADKAASKIRGEAGTTVKLVVKRGETEIPYTLTRAKINNPSVSSEVIGSTGIIKISRFDEQTGALARKAAAELKQKNVNSIIVDVRSDGGGYLSAAVDVAGLWLDNKVVVTQKKNGNVISTERTDNNAVLKDMKTIVLVNGGTASASEILAASLRDYGAATLLGEKTFGKGSVQQVIDLNNDALLKVTVARWYTPKNKNLDAGGLIPNQEIKLTDEDRNAGRDPQLDAAKQSLAN
jgi:carboxyl-terminal processing protease